MRYTLANISRNHVKYFSCKVYYDGEFKSDKPVNFIHSTYTLEEKTSTRSHALSFFCFNSRDTFFPVKFERD